MDKHKAELEISKTGQKETQLFTRNISEYAEINKLTGTMLNKLVEKIEVFEPTVIDGAKKQHIRIYYRCVGEIT